jgi:glyoxylate/hydroxypyruvate reductase A
MALQIDIRQPEWMREESLRDLLAPHLPGVPIHCGPPGDHAADIIMLATVKLHPGVAARLPNLKLVQKLGAGVDGIVRDPDLPARVRVCRLKPDAPAQEIAEYFAAHVLGRLRHIDRYRDQAVRGEWTQHPPGQCRGTTVAVLGLGHIGSVVADIFVRLGFRVMGWSRSLKDLPGVAAYSGEDGLDTVLGDADFIASVLPSTPQTAGLFDAARLSRLKPGAVLMNAGRGDLVIESDLLRALDAGCPAGAVLDVFATEPLPPEHPFWSHPKITVTPHVSGWHLEEGLDDVAENYRRLVAGEPLLHEVDRSAGY